MLAREADSKFAILLSAIGPDALERYKFWEYECSEEQCFDDYASKLRTLADACEFEERENMIRDKIVFFMKDNRIQERLLREVKLTFNRAVDMCGSAEATRKQMQSMKKGPVESVKAVYAVCSKSFSKHKPRPASAINQYSKRIESAKCGMCGRQHSPKGVLLGENLPKMQ